MQQIVDKEIPQILRGGIKYLQAQQQRNGSFLSLSSEYPDNFAQARTYHSTFSTALILTCLTDMPENAEISLIKQKAAAFLLKQKSTDWSFNYWQRDSVESSSMPYPDDLDDTFCALTALHTYNPKLLDGAAFAKIISLLTATEIEEGGPYRTWLVAEDAPKEWMDVDIAVNSNIAYFLSKQEISLPHLDEYITSVIVSDTLVSPYYHTDFPILYFLSRFYKGPRKDILISKILAKRKNGVWSNALENAFAILSLLELNFSPKALTKSIEALVAQQKDGIWKSESFYIDPTQQGKKHYAGSSALTTSFCLYALYTYKEASAAKKVLHSIDKDQVMMQKVHKLVLKKVKERFSVFGPGMKNEVSSNLLTIMNADISKQITLLPFYIAESVRGSKQKVPSELIINLGAASVYGWIAYTLYDNFLDDEGITSSLPIANVALRELTNLFITTVSNEKDFIKLFQQTMDELEQANYWEVTNCRIKVDNESLLLSSYTVPDYGTYAKLAERSMGHALAPAAILYYLGFNNKSPEIKNLLKFFRHYIIARQLNDDAHDFEEDIRRGHLNAVGAQILTTLRKKTKNLPEYLPELLPVMHEVFWKELVVVVCSDIIKHISVARKTISKNPAFPGTNIFEKMMAPIEASALKALEEHANVTKFLASYSKH